MMGRLYDAYVEVGPRFAGMGDIKSQGDKAGKEYGKALAEAAEKAAKANVRRLGEALAKARSSEADAAGKVRVAEEKLNEVRAQAKPKASALAAAEEAVASAHRKAAAASDTSKSAAEALGKAQKRVAEAASTAGKSSGGRFTDAFKGALSKLGGEKEGKEVATRFGVGLNGAIGSVVSRSAGVFAAGFAAVQGVRVFGSFVQDARESAKISRITANAIKATGGAAHITADQVGDLATAISDKTAIDDEQVQTAANMLLTFKNIRNEAGKGNDVFNQATQAAADLSVQFGGIDGASKQLGKALNDPIKGTSALAKAGVTFTDQQKKQIATLVKSGDVLGAQKIILKEISGQVGGAAAAAADPMEKLKVVAGNLAEEVGGFLLPAVNKFAGFATGTLIPGIKGLFSAFQGEGVTSDGFVGFMEKVGVASRGVFDYFKAEVLPRLKDFSGFVTGTVAPAIGKLVSRLTTELGPTVKDVFGFFKTEVIPRLQEFAGFVKDKVLPPVKEFADKILLSKDFLLPFAGVILGVVAALKAWAIAQGILNLVMAANPFGLVVIAIAALVGGIIYAYKHSEKFREIVQGAFQKIQEAAQFMAPLVKAAIDIVVGVFQLWWRVVKPILTGFWEAMKFAWERAQDFGRIVAAGFTAIKEPAKAAIRFVVETFLGMVSNILTGASKAFGWVPGIGPKLKTAAAEFNKFKTNVNNALNGINDQTITVTAKLNAANMNNKNAKDWRLGNQYATGGPVFGAGTATSDSIPAMLSNNEHVWTAKEVRNAGGHAAVESMRAQFRGYANGGAVSVGVRPRTSNPDRFAKEVAGHAVAALRPAAQALADKMFAFSGTPGNVRSFRGARLNDLTIARLQNAERLLGRMFHIMQGSYSTRVAASGSTHSGGGAMDTDGPGGWNSAVRALRTAGFAAWHRTPAQGPWGHHIHSIAIGDPSASAAAKRQVRDFQRGGDGLGGMAKGGAVKVYDRGGRWPSGTLGVNLSGKTETVTTGDDPIRLHQRDIDALADAIAQRPVMLDSRRVDAAMSNTALNGGYN